MPRWFVVALLSCSGCAFALGGPDPDRPRGQAPRCDTSKGLVALDGVMAGTMGLVAVGLAANEAPEIALLPLAIGALYLGGAFSGNNKVNKCRAAMDDFAGVDRISAPALGSPGRAEEDDEHEGDPPVYDGRPRARRREPAPPVAVEAQEERQPATHGPAQSALDPVQAPPPPMKPATKPATKPAPARDEPEEWADFWREAP